MVINTKEKVALGSVIAAILLTVTKLVVGYTTNSLGIISEALHSSIDLIAAIMTFFAVKWAARPPDADHLYGHEKVESLSSLAETLLLFITCAWIVYEAMERLFFKTAVVDITIAAILVMLLSIAVDYTRSRALHRTAVKYKSQALEADAIHFSTDLISSVVVIIGVVLTWSGIKYVDSIAALAVAVITAVIGYRLWKRSMHTLMDGAPEGISDKVTREIMSVQGIHKVERVRVRESGAVTFIEATVYIDKVLPVEQGHMLTYLAEEKVKAAIPDSDIIVHAEPICIANASLEDRIRAEAANLPDVKDVHNISIIESTVGRLVEFHVEMDGDLPVSKAHEVVSDLEERVKAIDLCIAKVATHIEPFGCPICRGEVADLERASIQDTIDHICGLFPEVLSCNDIQVHFLRSGGYKVNMCCQFDPKVSVTKAHEVATRLEGHIRSRHTEIDSITIHVEPSA